MRKLLILTVFLIAAPSATPAATAQELSLDQAFRAAMEKNETIHQSSELVTQAEARVSRLRGAIMPDLAFNANHLIQPTPDDPIAREFSPAQQTTANFTVVQPVFRGLREFATLRQQKQLLSAQHEVQKQTTQRLYQDVAVNYLNILSLEQDLKNLNEQVEIYGRRSEEVRGRTRRGESSTTEMLATLSTQNSLLAERRLVEGQVRVARENFAFLTGKPRDTKLTDPALDPTAKKIVADDLNHYLARIERRPDIQAAQARLEAADEGVAIARGAHFPAIDAVGNYYLKRPGFLSDIKWDVSFRLSVPIFSGGTTQAQVREAVAQNRQNELELARLRRLAEEEIRSLHEGLTARLEHISFLKESAEVAQKNVSVSQSEFRRGLTRNIDVQQALADYRVIRRSLDQAHFAAQTDLVKLEIAAGMKPEGLLAGAVQ